MTGDRHPTEERLIEILACDEVSVEALDEPSDPFSYHGNGGVGDAVQHCGRDIEALLSALEDTQFVFYMKGSRLGERYEQDGIEATGPETPKRFVRVRREWLENGEREAERKVNKQDDESVDWFRPAHCGVATARRDSSSSGSVTLLQQPNSSALGAKRKLQP